ncbi:MAG: D-alanyl-D-alanine carboxypeptidase [Desulfamplus sp.]|nr:D-alanyl-D-alanine carboxypeptidase [Desulfamplus sp.]
MTRELFNFIINRIRAKYLFSISLYCFCSISLLNVTYSFADEKPTLNTQPLNNNAGIVLCTENGKVLCSQNENRGFVPASTLKVLTSLSARHYFGEDYRFKTDFFLERYASNINLKIKGYGDPLFTSPTIHDACRELSSILKSINITSINDVIVDNSFFASDINIDGKSDTNNPYDAFVGALSANFNTVAFRYSKAEQSYISDDPETPLLPFVMNRVQSSGLKRGRVVLSEEESRLYAGILIQHFLSQEGIVVKGQVTRGVVSRGDRLIYKFISPYDIDEITRRLLAYSSNFMANQLFLSAGARAFSPPATIEKGVAAVADYAKGVVGISASKQANFRNSNHAYADSGNSNVVIVEGSGLSRKNRISPADMVKVLKRFRPDYHLMKSEAIEGESVKVAYSGDDMRIARGNMAIGGNEYYKTGTLNGVRTRCGYFETSKGLYPFVIMINEAGAGYDKIRQFLWNSVLAYEGKR